MKHFLLLFTFILSPALLFAQSNSRSLNGYIKDEAGQPIPYLSIGLEGTVLGTSTNSAGYFELKNLKPGNYKLHISGVGYETVSQKVDLTNEQNPELNLQIKTNTSALNEVVVSAGRTVEALDETPVSVQVLNQATLQTQTKVNPNIAAVLAYTVPGLGLNSNTTSNVGQTLRGRNVLIMVDGIPQSTPLRAGSRDVRTIDPEAIERVEIVKGATAVYGNGADGGLINYITKKASANKPFTAYTSLANTGTLVHRNNTAGGRLSQQFSGKLNRFDYLVSGTYEQTGVYKDGEGKVLSPIYGLGETQLYNGFLKTGYNITEDQRVELMYNYFSSRQSSNYIEKAGIYGQYPTIGVLGEHKGVAEGTKYNHNAQLKYSALNVFRKTGLEASIYTQKFYTIYGFTASFKDGGQSTILSDKKGARLSFNTPFIVNEFLQGNVIYGADYLNDVTSQPLVDGRTWVPKMKLQNAAPYAQLQLTFLEDFIFKAGVRFDNVEVKVPSFTQVIKSNGSGGKFINGGNIKFDATSFNVGLRYARFDFFKPFVSYSQGFSIIDIGRYVRDAKENDIANMNIEPVTVNNYEAGFHSKIGIVSLSGSAYLSTSNLGASLVPVGDQGIFEIQRAPERIYGFEAVADIFMTKKIQLGASAGYTEGKADLNNNKKYEDAEDTYLNGSRIPPLKVTAYTNLKPVSKLNLNIQWVYSGNRNRFDVQPNGKYLDTYGKVKAFDIFNLSGSYEFSEKVSLTLGVENLLNKTYYLPIAYSYARDLDYTRANGARYQLGVAIKW
jgi:iron complex outermembrane receptor protein